MTLAPWLGIALVLGLLGLFMVALRGFQKLAAPHPELTRKLLHVGMGLVTLSFPWLFDADWPVIVLAGLSITGLLLVRVVGSLKGSLGAVVGGVARQSLGEIYFPLAVGILFVLHRHQETVPPDRRLMLYCIPLLLLTLADAAAALVGMRYGQLRYSTVDGQKSAEGSAAFFTCAFLLVQLPLLLATDTGRVETVLIALLLAWLAMLFEAISWGGLDNLVLPLIGFLLLRIYFDQPIAALLQRVLVTGVLLGVLLIYRRYTTLRGSAVLGAFLMGYVCWALGGWHWLVAPVILFLTYSFLSRRTPLDQRTGHTVHGVLCVSTAGLLWLFLSRLLNRPELLFPFTLTFAAHLAIIAVASFKYDHPRLAAGVVLPLAITMSWLFVFVPYLLAEGMTDLGNLLNALWALPGVALAAVVFYFTQPKIENCPTDTPRWLRQAFAAGLGSLVAIVPLYGSALAWRHGDEVSIIPFGGRSEIDASRHAPRRSPIDR